MAKVSIKWGKESFDIDVEAGSTPEVFKTQVWTITNVPVDKQKYAGFVGGLKDDVDLMAQVEKLKGKKVMLIGTAEEKQLQEPAEKVVFEEDLTPEQRAKLYKEKKVEVLPPGIKNLGNTCYMNSTLQVLFRSEELKTAIQSYNAPASADRDIDATLTMQSKTVISQLSSAHDAIVPMAFVGALRQRFPRFAEMQNGGFMQQDAEECLRGILQVFSGTLKVGEGNSIDNLFGFSMKSTMKCLECDEEPPVDAIEPMKTLTCHLGTQTEQVSHIHQGVMLSMKEHIEKQSPVLGRNAQYEKSTAVESLPPFLLVQFARFGYKGANEWAGTSAGKVKLTKRCAFTNNLDVFDFASEDLKKELSKGRMEKKRQDDEELEKKKKAMLEAKAGEAAPAEEEEEASNPANLEEMDTGYYELIGVVSHKGRTADGGHYVGWGRHKKANGKDLKDDQWILFDDEDTTWWNWKDMVGLTCDLQGGKADTQIAYINLYKKINVLGKKGEVSGTADPVADDAAKSSTDKPAA